ncbi:hypothetical protein V8E55_009848 [Tylopilus felleus]
MRLEVVIVWITGTAATVFATDIVLLAEGCRSANGNCHPSNCRRLVEWCGRTWQNVGGTDLDVLCRSEKKTCRH